jgi:hypothetical protein
MAEHREFARAWVATIGGQHYAIPPDSASVLMNIAHDASKATFGLLSDGSYGMEVRDDMQKDPESYFITRVEFMQVEIIHDIPDDDGDSAAEPSKPDPSPF